jgi:hypothetical protein
LCSTAIDVVATDELAEGLISASIDPSVVMPIASGIRGTLPLACIGSLRVLCTTASKGVLSSAPSTAFGASTGGRESIVPYPEPRSFSQKVPFHTRLGRLRTMSSGARSRRAARAARARWTRSVQRVSREGRVRTMRKDKIGLESGPVQEPIRNHNRHKFSREDRDGRQSRTCTIPMEVRRPAAWRLF